MRQGQKLTPQAPAEAPGKRGLRRYGIGCTVFTLCVLALTAAFFATRRLPFPLAALSPEPSTMVVARNGEFLRFFLAPDQSWRFPVRLEAISPILPQLVIAAEDRHFRQHPGVDPLALIRATLANLRVGHIVSGGSTITMQLARLANPQPRTLQAKISEALAALALERRFGKDAILERYFNMAPYGGNIVGVGAASTFYFGKTPDRLSLAEAALLTVLPRAPLRLNPLRHPQAAKAARDALLAAMVRKNILEPAAAREAIKKPVPSTLFRIPFAAPQFCRMAKERNETSPRIETTLDPTVQQTATGILRDRKSWLAAQGIGAVAAVVLDPKTHDVMAMVGSTDFFGDTRFGQINGTTIRRSPGSALKPFLYAMGLDAGTIFPQSLLLDIPTGFGGYAPKNYDGHFRGRVTMDQALVTSLNVPAVRLLNDIGVPSFLDLLHRGGLDTLDKPAAHYGLSLILGGGEVTLLSLTNLYAALADSGSYRPPRILKTAPIPDPIRLFSPEACALITESLTKLERPDLPTSWERALAVPAVAWKTGTSYGHRDAWAVGYSADHVIGVWVGNMDGTPVKGISGAAHAGPILFELFRGVETQGSKLATPSWLNIREVEVCAESRELPGPDCPRTVTARIIPGVTKLRPCTIHRRMLVDATSGQALSGHCLSTHEVKSVAVALYPPELVSWWRASGIPFAAPPEPAPECAAPRGPGPRIVSPSPATPYILRADIPMAFQQVALVADTPAQSRRISWYVDGTLTAQGHASERLFWQPTPGTHRFVVADDQGRTDTATIRIEQ